MTDKKYNQINKFYYEIKEDWLILYKRENYPIINGPLLFRGISNLNGKKINYEDPKSMKKCLTDLIEIGHKVFNLPKERPYEIHKLSQTKIPIFSQK